MTINYRTDSDNVTHQVWAQRQANSCAVASIWMARNQAKQMTINETEWSLAWRMYHRVVQGMDSVPEAPAPMSLNPGAFPSNQRTFNNMFANFGTYSNQIVRMLKMDGLTPRITSYSPGIKVDAQKLSDTTPAIVIVGWYSGTTRNGGHAIVASRKTQAGRIVYLDPWGGQLSELGFGPRYQTTGIFEQVIYVSA